MKNQVFGILLLALLVLCFGGCVANQNAPTPIEETEVPTPIQLTATPTVSTAEIPLSVETTKGLVFAKDNWRKRTFERKLDLYAPTEAGNWPILLFLPGSGWSIGMLSDLAETITERGVMVFVVDYPMMDLEFGVLEKGKGYRLATETVACATHYARTIALDSGNESPIVAISGFSMGAGVGTHVALAGESFHQIWDEYSAPTGEPASKIECTVDESSTHVDALIGIAGPYDAFVGYEGKYGRDFLQKHDHGLWELFFGTIGKNPDLKVRLLHSEDDGTISYENTEKFKNLLAEAGYDVQLIPFNGGHKVPHDLTVETIMDVLQTVSVDD